MIHEQKIQKIGWIHLRGENNKYVLKNYFTWLLHSWFRDSLHIPEVATCQGDVPILFLLDVDIYLWHQTIYNIRDLFVMFQAELRLVNIFSAK